MQNLPNIFGPYGLANLTINETNASAITDFEFILQFRALFEFQTNQQWKGAFDCAAKAFKQTHLLRIQFREDDEQVEIRRRSFVRPGNATYDLEVFKLEHKDQVGEQRYYKQNLKWAELIRLWKQRKEPGTGQAVSDETDRRSRK